MSAMPIGAKCAARTPTRRHGRLQESGHFRREFGGGVQQVGDSGERAYEAHALTLQVRPE